VTEAPPTELQEAAGVGTSWGRALIIPALALLSALIIGALIMALSDIESLRLLGSDPGAALAKMWSEIVVAYRALFRGAFGSIYALSESLFAATPLIIAGLGVALGFRAGLFNIGANGQMLFGGLAALLVGLYLDLPGFIHITLALVAGMLGGMIWGGIPGLLKARTGAHEVITTIMFNFIAVFLVQWLLTLPLIQDPGRNNPISAPMAVTARLPRLLGANYRATIGVLIALALVFVIQWLIFRSSKGFELRVMGLNPEAGRYAGMSVTGLTTLAMSIAGGLAGIAGAIVLMGLDPFKLTTHLAGSVGFDAITVALLGRSHPLGVLVSALLFGALKAGGREMQGAAQVPLDLVTVLQALIVIFVAAPAMVRAIYRVRGEGSRPAPISKGWGT
jgi:ABC-type uncharacterized transport system permease subunit